MAGAVAVDGHGGPWRDPRIVSGSPGESARRPKTIRRLLVDGQRGVLRGHVRERHAILAAPQMESPADPVFGQVDPEEHAASRAKGRGVCPMPVRTGFHAFEESAS